MSEDNPITAPYDKGSGGKGYLYANRVSRLKIATMIENAQSTSRHPYVSIIRGRDMESVNSFSEGVIEILELHGNHIVYPEKMDSRPDGKAKASSENIIYVIDQSYIEQKAREKHITMPVSSSDLIRGLGLSVSPNSKVIIKVTTEYSGNIITENSIGEMTSAASERKLQRSPDVNIPSSASTLAFYFGAVSFASAAIIQALLLYTQILGPSLVYQSLSLVNVGLIFFIITLISYALRYSGYKAMNFYERFVTLAAGLLFIASAIITYEAFVRDNVIPNQGVSMVPLLAGPATLIGALFKVININIPLAVMTAAQITLFSLRLKRWPSSIAVAVFSSLPLIAPYFVDSGITGYYSVSFGGGFYFIRESVFTNTSSFIHETIFTNTSASITVSIIFVISNAFLALLFFHIGKSGFKSQRHDHDEAQNPAKTGT